MAALRNNGERFPIELSLSAGQHGGQRFALGIIRDITERRWAEQELGKAHEEDLMREAIVGDLVRTILKQLSTL